MYIYVRGTVGGFADFVGDVDATFAGEGLSVGVIEAGEGASGALEAVTDGLFVWGGPGGAKEGLNAVTAVGRRNATPLEVTEARDHGGGDLDAGDGGFRHGGCHHG